MTTCDARTTEHNRLGVLTSQVGYEIEQTKRLIIRCGCRDRLTDSTPFVLRTDGGCAVHHGHLLYWGQLWSSHWWIGDFSDLRTAGTYVAEFRDRDARPQQSDPLDIGSRILWDRAFEPMALGQLERRAVLAKAKVGWMDAGMPWQEANAHAAMVVGLADAAEHAADRLRGEEQRRLLAQIVNGCDYLALLQDEAQRRGHPAGGLSHMVPGYEDQVIAADAAKAALAFARAAAVLAASDAPASQPYLQRACRALAFAMAHPPASDNGFHRGQRGLPETYTPPVDEHPTCDLLMMAWAAVVLLRLGKTEYEAVAVALLDQVMQRQAVDGEALHGLCGYFFEFSDRHHAEPAWAHQIKTQPVGLDAGASVPHGLNPMIELLRLHPDHPQATRWRDCLRRFAYQYFLPACRQNPFLLLPLLLHREEGLIWFAGPWHGTNAIYGQAAVIALELADLFGDAAFCEIAVGNVQWIAGLNAGLTPEALKGCVVYSAPIPADAILPCSLIHGVGRRFAGSWMNLRGAVCNGFSVGRQFEFDTPVMRRNDGPHSLTDEDWIPHAAGWISAISRF